LFQLLHDQAAARRTPFEASEASHADTGLSQDTQPLYAALLETLTKFVGVQLFNRERSEGEQRSRVLKELAAGMILQI
jgi:hypothetical protein